MKKKINLIILIILLITFPSVVNAGVTLKSSSCGYSYYEYMPAGANSNTPVIMAVHGMGAGQGEVGNFAPYQALSSGSYNPNAIVIIPTKASTGHWNTSSLACIAKSYYNSGYKGKYGYYGFSMGAYDASSTISQAGIFSNAVLVDGKGISAPSLSNLKSVTLYCGCDCYSDQQIGTLNSQLSSSGVTFNYNTQYRMGNCNKHGSMPGWTYQAGFNALISGNVSSNISPGASTGSVGENAIPGGTSGSSSSGQGNDALSGFIKDVQKIEIPDENIGDDVCKDENVLKAMKVIGSILLVTRLLIPFIIILYSSLDFYNILTKEPESEFKKQAIKFLMRLAVGIFVFFLPALINAFLGMLYEYQAIEDDLTTCQQCLINPRDCGNEVKEENKE